MQWPDILDFIIMGEVWFLGLGANPTLSFPSSSPLSIALEV